MFGTLRFLLAILVAISHTYATFEHFQIGVFAVVVFFMISGYAMTGLIDSRFSRLSAYWYFILERLLRITPLYYFWFFISLLEIFYYRWNPIRVPDLVYSMFAYMTILPLGLQGLMPVAQSYFLAQASSLGIEILFYILAPFLLISKALFRISALALLVLFLFTAMGRLPAALYTYYCAPGEILFCLIGSLLYRKNWIELLAVGSCTVAVLLLSLSQPYGIEMLCGLVVGAVAILILPKLRPEKWDTALGNMSYSLFLGHGCVNVVYFYYAGQHILMSNMLNRVPSTVIACAVSYLAYLIVERPTVPFRKSIGRGRDPSRAKTAV